LFFGETTGELTAMKSSNNFNFFWASYLTWDTWDLGCWEDDDDTEAAFKTDVSSQRHKLEPRSPWGRCINICPIIWKEKIEDSLFPILRQFLTFSGSDSWPKFPLASPTRRGRRGGEILQETEESFT
jgi:hypothetical protein